MKAVCSFKGTKYGGLRNPLWETLYKLLGRCDRVIADVCRNDQRSCEPLNLENKLWKNITRHYSYIRYIHTLLYLSLDVRVAYAANNSDHLTIRLEIDNHTRNYVTNSFAFVFSYLALKKSSGAINYSFISIAFAQCHVIMCGKRTKTFLESNR